ncbi:ATP-binding protein [Sphingobacterium olei]|uniref:ATP-binding protein n=1 Tax=Sphingobacterium olei TaxID=2571155 RepID=A0A4U0P2F6_9SPHI|nr:ATP-binding protein [Sphingobacterium olei]TJZ61290.1 ATP-binding protein [Sphingobacterium olei]
MMFVTRRIANKINEVKDKYPIIALTGPRQSGKTTLLKNTFPTYRYISLEDPDIREFAESDPTAFLDLYDKYVILDEIQRVPQLFSYLQGRVDESGLMGQYILSGSQNFNLLKSITQSLAGRVALFKLLPFDLEELKAHQLLSEDYADNTLRGFYPAIYDREINPSIFYSNYLQTYIDKDVTELLKIKDFRQFRQFIKLCANRAGQLLNLSALANEADISFNTAKEWLSILESSYITFLLHPYYENRNKRLVKTPKLYFYDAGLLCFLLGIKTTEQLLLDQARGNIFENMIIAEHIKSTNHLYQFNDLYFWQDSNGNEIDLLWKVDRTFIATEIKAAKTITTEMFKQLDKFESYQETHVQKVLIYGGNQSQKRSKYLVRSWNEASDGSLYK